MNEYKYDFEDFAAKMMKKASLAIKDSDLECQEIENYIVIHNDRFNSIINTLKSDDKTFCRDYTKKQIYLKEAINEDLYFAGYKDCVKLLKVLGVL